MEKFNGLGGPRIRFAVLLWALSLGTSAGCAAKPVGAGADMAQPSDVPVDTHAAGSADSAGAPGDADADGPGLQTAETVASSADTVNSGDSADSSDAAGGEDAAEILADAVAGTDAAGAPEVAPEVAPEIAPDISADVAELEAFSVADTVVADAPAETTPGDTAFAPEAVCVGDVFAPGFDAVFSIEHCKGVACQCPPVPYPAGSACCPDCVLKCDYPNCCGYTNQWHCKYGKWQLNTWYACP